ncbi:NUDIX hydrolase domain-like protein [Multifurca ochricompacta]|uniref:NUDIX hydrolase domain-like protein n=1 Tax=Multifurca ochricompacta TaxID=376703 RepID=A0AAD4QJM6_9AGAM|nr:NUDIX hydrolase domain-like protein [Multifurca ochricompacta]
MTAVHETESLINVVNTCDNFRPHLSSEPLVPFLLAPNIRPALGLLRPSVVAALRADNDWRNAHGRPLAWNIPKDSDTDNGNGVPLPYVAFSPPLASGTPAARTLALADTLERWRAAANDGDGKYSANEFAGVIGGTRWRAEWYDVYLTPGGALRADGRDPLNVLEAPMNARAYVFSMERSACALFGVITYGVHMTVYEQDAHGCVQVWVPRRALTKPTFPGMLDNSVAGGIPGGTTVLDTVVKEATEEASLDPELVRRLARAVGAVSYYFQTKAGWLQPEVEYVYDMCLEPGEAQLAPMDGEVEYFELMSLDEIIVHMHAGDFKPNCALVLIDFMPRYVEITQRLHGQLDLEKW